MNFRFEDGKKNFSRSLLVERFTREVLPLLNLDAPLRVAIVGGSESDEEVSALRNVNASIKYTTFGIEDAEIYLDLNSDWENSDFEKFDLVLCSQVFEHIWNHRQASITLLAIAKENGLVWISVPASNRPHGSPEYFSAGLTADYLQNLFSLSRGNTVSSGLIGTKRNYAATHSLPYWLSISAHRFPIVFGPADRVWWKRILYLIKFFPTNLRLAFTNPKVKFDLENATESWILIRA